MKKLLISILIAVTVLTTLLLVACNPTTVDNVEGTYVLVTDTKRHRDDAEATDYIADYGKYAYLVIKADGTGYYVFGERDREVTCRNATITFTHGASDPDDISYIEVRHNLDTFTLYVDYNKKEKHTRLVYNINPTSSGILAQYEIRIAYDKISSDTTLSTVEKELGTDLNVA